MKWKVDLFYLAKIIFVKENRKNNMSYNIHVILSKVWFYFKIYGDFWMRKYFFLNSEINHKLGFWNDEATSTIIFFQTENNIFTGNRTFN